MNVVSPANTKGRLAARLLLIVALAGSVTLALPESAAAAYVSPRSQFDCAGPVHGASWTNYGDANWNSWAAARMNVYHNDPSLGWVHHNTDTAETWYGSSGSAVATATAPPYSGQWQVRGTHWGSSDLFARAVYTYADGWCP